MGWVEKSEYSAQHELYLSRQEILDEEDADKLHKEIKDQAFTGYRVSLSLVSLRQSTTLSQKKRRQTYDLVRPLRTLDRIGRRPRRTQSADRPEDG